MSTTSKVAGFALLAIAANEARLAWRRHHNRGLLYRRAAALARAEGRTLVIVGDPDTGLHTRLARAYGCEEPVGGQGLAAPPPLCVDLTGCPSCPRGVTADLTAGPISSVPDDTAVVFVSEVMECIPADRVQTAWREIQRMAGSPERVFSIGLEPWSLTGTFYPSTRSEVPELCSNGQPDMLDPVPIDPRRVFAYAGVLTALTYFALRPEGEPAPMRVDESWSRP